MGCATSKIDDLPAVILCRHRLEFLHQSLLLRHSLSDSHLSYSHSLSSLSSSLHLFFHSSSTTTTTTTTTTLPPPLLTKPSVSSSSSSPSSTHLPLSSDSPHHLHFHSDSDSPPHHHHHHDLSQSGSPSPSHTGSPNTLQHHSYPYPNPYQNDYPYGGGSAGGGGGGYMHMNYMRRHVTPSVSYEQRPIYAETVHFGDTSPPAASSSSAPYYYGGGGASTSKERVVPPPPPPATSAWDFLNPFESIESGYAHYAQTPSSRDSREVREEEGIPELEDEDFDHEVVKKVVVDDKVIGRPSNDGTSKKVADDGDDGHLESLSSSDDEEDGEDGVAGGEKAVRVSGAGEESGVEYEVRMVDKKVVGDEAGEGKSSGGGGGRSAGFKSVFEVVKEIQVQFESAAAAGDFLTKVLEVGKLRYQRKNPAFQVSTKMLNVITPSLPLVSKETETSMEVDEDVQLRSLNLSASLQKLYLWEKKLYEEVKSEEKMRVSHDRKLRKLQQMIERGAEPQKIESLRSMVRSLSTKISIAIQIVDRISAKINKVRDEELWPQLNELIQGFSRMWKAMLECHRSQCEAIDAGRGLDAIAFPSNPSDTHLEATLQLEHDLINWTCRFTDWVGAQKGYVRALNSWLLKCLLHEPEETADGIAPFSPGRVGAPPIFVICHQWNQSLERVAETSEKEVINSMRVFAMMVLHFRERDKGEMKQRMTVNRDIERKVKNLDREDLKIHKEIQALDKKMELTSGASDGLSLSGHVVYQSDTSSKTSLQAGLRSIFEALERFTADSVKVYEDLIERTEEVVRVHGTAS
ncbi:hypothetical protein vseg_007055 [Gypsophila vaccaria]